MLGPDRFSKRHGFGEVQPAEIRIRDEAPSELRGVVLNLAYECGMSPSRLREIICHVLRRRPDPNNWAERPNIAEENEELIDGCPWYEVYDVIEAVLADLQRSGLITIAGIPATTYFEEELNRYCLREGIGWGVAAGLVEYRGSEPFQAAIEQAESVMSAKGMTTSSNELHQALMDLSRRPSPDITGAVQHAFAAVECLTREVTGNPRATLGELLERYPDLFPKSVDEICKKAWGYASEFGRHLREGRAPNLPEAELMVHLSAALCSYLAKKNLKG